MNQTQINKKLKELKVIFFDADGVFFDGTETSGMIGGKRIILKTRHFADSLAISFLREMQIKIVFVSGEAEPLISIIKKLNNSPSTKNKRWQKIEVFSNQQTLGSKLEKIKLWLKKNNVSPLFCAYMGDDINDITPMNYIKKNSGLTITPANGVKKIKLIADIVTKQTGGHGAIRELCEIIIKTRNKKEEGFLTA